MGVDLEFVSALALLHLLVSNQPGRDIGVDHLLLMPVEVDALGFIRTECGRCSHCSLSGRSAHYWLHLLACSVRIEFQAFILTTVMSCV